MPELDQGGRGGVEEQIVERRLVVLDQGVEVMRQGEHQIEKRDRQERLGMLLQPVHAVGPLAGPTMAVATRMRDEMVAVAVRAPVEMTAQLGGRHAWIARSTFQ